MADGCEHHGGGCQHLHEHFHLHLHAHPPSHHDLVIRTVPSFSFNNRWKFSEEDELVDYDRIQDWHFTQLDNNLHLRRIKIYGLSRDRIAKLLRSLSAHGENSRLQRLEIDRLEISRVNDLRAHYRLYALLSLSIDSVAIVDADGKRLKPVPANTNSTVTFDAPNLRMLYLGQNSLKYIQFTDPSNVVELVIGPLKDAARLAEFTSLQNLIVEAVEYSNADAIVQIAEPDRLNELHCNLAKQNSTAFAPDQNQLAYLESLYDRLRELHEVTKDEHTAFLREGQLAVNRHRCWVFFNYVHLKFDRPFADYHFEDTLIDLHYRNVVHQCHCPGECINDHTEYESFLGADTPKCPPLVPCQAVSELNYLGLFDTYLKSLPTCKEEEERIFFSIMKFMRLYSSIRVVVLDNSGSQRRPDATLFLRVLGECFRALTEVRILCPNFGAEFYGKLVDLNSVNQTLDRLTIWEAYPYAPLIDIGAILQRLPRLHRLSTNLASKQQMIDSLGKMRRLATYEFTFTLGAEPADSYRCEIRNADDYEWLLIVKLVNGETANESKLVAKRFPLDSLISFFNKPQNTPITSHWQDALRQKPQISQKPVTI